MLSHTVSEYFGSLGDNHKVLREVESEHEAATLNARDVKLAYL